MVDKLTTEHYTAYLEHSLKIFDPRTKQEFLLSAVDGDTQMVKYTHSEYDWSDYDAFKLCLRPIEDITKAEFLPSWYRFKVEEFEVIELENSLSVRYILGGVATFKIIHLGGKFTMCTYGVVLLLLKNHFDIFGLLDSELAVPKK